MTPELAIPITYIRDYHWVFYGLGFAVAPRLTIMIALSLYSNNFIPLPLMIVGWLYVIGAKFNTKNYAKEFVEQTNKLR